MGCCFLKGILTTIIKRCTLLLFGLLFGLLLAEGLLRVWTPESLSLAGRGQRIAPDEPKNPHFGSFELDEELGYRPKPGGQMFDAKGAKRNEYAILKPEGVRRVLFLGDSVTYRGALIDGFRMFHGDAGVEYWNVGIEGYSTRQEVLYYERYCGRMNEDHLILTFHMNDFTGTPVLFMDGEELVLHRLNRPVKRPHQRLLKLSHLYRLYIRLSLLNDQQEEAGPEAEAEIDAEIETSLEKLKNLTARRGARLTVILFPWLKPLDEWKDSALRNRRSILEILERQQIEYHDLLDSLNAALEAGFTIRQHPSDSMHPSPAFGAFAAKALLAAGLEL